MWKFDLKYHFYYILAFVLNFRNCCKTFHCKTFSATFMKNFPELLVCPSLLKIPILITLPISFSFNQGITFLYKYSWLCFKKSVFNWTFCQLLYSWKNPIVRKYVCHHHKLVIYYNRDFIENHHFFILARSFTNSDALHSAKLPRDVSRGRRQGQVRLHRQGQRQQEGKTGRLQRSGRAG